MVTPRRVACFRGAHNLQEVLDDFRSEIKLGTADIYDVVENCSELARAKHYKMFALGRMACAYLELTFKTNTISVARMGRSVKTVSAREIVCSFIP